MSKITKRVLDSWKALLGLEPKWNLTVSICIKSQWLQIEIKLLLELLLLKQFCCVYKDG